MAHKGKGREMLKLTQAYYNHLKFLKDFTQPLSALVTSVSNEQFLFERK